MTARVELYRTPDHVIVEHPDGIPERVDVPQQWRWRFVKNGRVMADSGQGYVRRTDALSGCATVLGGAVQSDQHAAWVHRFVWDEHVRDVFHPQIQPLREAIPVRDLTRQP